MKACVVGSGSWGSALAQVLADRGLDVCIKARRDEIARSITDRHINPDYFPDVVLPASVWSSTSYEEALSNADVCVLVTPSKFIRDTVSDLKPFWDPNMVVVECSKGVEAQTGYLPVQIVREVLGKEAKIAVLSGPTHAEEVIRRIPTGAVSASWDESSAKFIQSIFKTDYFRTYTSSDVVGVELCAAFKNVIAIAVGISYGIGMGDNTAATLITRGLAEMSRMVTACGGQAITCLGLAGAGDMVVTCMSEHSRNRRFGQFYIARGLNIEDFERDTHMVVEGARACKTLESLSKKHEVELPLTDAIREIVWEGASPDIMAKALIDRPLKDEF